MEAFEEKLYSELRNTKRELIRKLEDKYSSPLIKPIIKEELFDVEETLKKIENGNFGICEASGEMIPHDLLYMVPTLKSIKDCSRLGRFYRKSFFDC